jgi:RNA polymerase sigma-70 factor (ECF subfamily)
VLLLRDVLGWSAAEAARLLDASVPSVNSALQRARVTLEQRFPSGRPDARAVPDDQQRPLLQRYVRAWEGADIDGLVALLREDAVMSMPPWSEWYVGPDSIRAFLVHAWSPSGCGFSEFRAIATGANRQSAFAVYVRDRDSGEFHSHGIQLLTVRDDAVAAMTTFRDTGLFARFGLPDVLRTGAAAPASRG